MIYNYLSLGNRVSEIQEAANMYMIGYDCGDGAKTTLTIRSNRARLSPPSPFLIEIEEVDLLSSNTEAHEIYGGCYGCHSSLKDFSRKMLAICPKDKSLGNQRCIGGG
jgi:hypothetical protein